MTLTAARFKGIFISVCILAITMSGLPTYSSSHQSVHSIPQSSTHASPFPLSAYSAHKIAPPWMEPLTDAQLAEQKALDKAGKDAEAKGDWKTAEVNFENSLQLSDENQDDLLGLIKAYREDGNSKQAIKVYRYLLSPNKRWSTSLEQDPMLQTKFILLLISDGQWPEAVSVYEKMLPEIGSSVLDPEINVHFNSEYPQPQLLECMAYIIRGNFYSDNHDPRGIEDIRKALALVPNSALAHFYYGEALVTAGNRKQAKQEIDKAATIGDDHIKICAKNWQPLL